MKILFREPIQIGRTLAQRKLLAKLRGFVRAQPAAPVRRSITVPASRPCPKGEEPARLVA